MAGARPSAPAEPGHALAVPALEGLQQRLAHRGAELQPRGKIARLLAVRLHDLLHRPARGRQELPDHPDPAETRLAAAEMTGDEDRHADAPEVPVVACRRTTPSRRRTAPPAQLVSTAQPTQVSSDV